MAGDSKELHILIPLEIENALAATARAFGTDKSSVAREVLGEWAAKKLHEARVHIGLARANGGTMESERQGTGTFKVLSRESPTKE